MSVMELKINRGRYALAVIRDKAEARHISLSVKKRPTDLQTYSIWIRTMNAIDWNEEVFRNWAAKFLDCVAQCRQPSGAEPEACPARLTTVIDTIRRSGKTNMLDIPAVVLLALDRSENEVANWINTHHRDYAHIIFNGRTDHG